MLEESCFKGDEGSIYESFEARKYFKRFAVTEIINRAEAFPPYSNALLFSCCS